MARLPYGFDAHRPYVNDDGLRDANTDAEAWAKLDDVQTCLSKQQILPPELAAWLGEAIRHCGQNPDELLRRLGVKRRRGERGGYSRNFKEYWQARLWHLGTYNGDSHSVDQLVKAVQDEMTAEEVLEVPTRETLQDWFAEAMTGSARVR